MPAGGSPLTAAVIFLSGLLLGSAVGLGAIRKHVSQIEAPRNPLFSEKMPGDTCDPREARERGRWPFWPFAQEP